MQTLAVDLKSLLIATLRSMMLSVMKLGPESILFGLLRTKIPLLKMIQLMQRPKIWVVETVSEREDVLRRTLLIVSIIL